MVFFVPHCTCDDVFFLADRTIEILSVFCLNSFPLLPNVTGPLNIIVTLFRSFRYDVRKLTKVSLSLTGPIRVSIFLPPVQHEIENKIGRTHHACEGQREQ